MTRPSAATHQRNAGSPRRSATKAEASAARASDTVRAPPSSAKTSPLDRAATAPAEKAPRPTRTAGGASCGKPSRNRRAAATKRSADERRGERHRARSGTMREAHIGDGDGAEGRQGRGAGVDRGDQRSQLVARAQAPPGESSDAESGEGRES